MANLLDAQGYAADDESFDAAEKQKLSNRPDSAVFTDGLATWHGVGRVLDQSHVTAEEALRFAELGGWDLRKFPLEVRIFDDAGNESVVPVPGGKSAIVRMDTRAVLGTVGDRYEIVSNEDAFAWADALVGGEGCHYKTAGSLYGGRIVWLQLEVPFTVQLPDSEYKSYLYLSSSHDGTRAIEAGYWNKRIVCSNTLKLAHGQGTDRIRIKHTQTARERLAAAQRALGLAQGAADRAQKIAESLYAQKVTPKRVESVLEQLFPITRDESAVAKRHAEAKREAVRDIYNADALGQREIRGTAYGILNAAARYDDLTVENAKSEAKAHRAFDSIMSGDSLSDTALAILTA